MITLFWCEDIHPFIKAQPPDLIPYLVLPPKTKWLRKTHRYPEKGRLFRVMENALPGETSWRRQWVKCRANSQWSFQILVCCFRHSTVSSCDIILIALDLCTGVSCLWISVGLETRTGPACLVSFLGPGFVFSTAQQLSCPYSIQLNSLLSLSSPGLSLAGFWGLL